MKLLIVGSSGYVGKNLIDLYSKNSTYEIYGISRRKNSNPKLKNNFCGDVTDSNFLLSIDIKFNLIINCVAKTEHFGDRKKFYKNNVESVKSLLSSFDGKFKTFIHLSSEAVFLNGKISFLKDRQALPKDNISDYSWSKRLAEEFINKYQTFSNPKANSKIITIRPRLIWGGVDSIVACKLIHALKINRFFYVDRGDYLTSSTHISNLYKGINCAVKYGKNKQVYFVTDGNPIKFRLLIDKILGGRVSGDAISMPRGLVYFLCLFCDIVYVITFKKIRLPLSMSLYFLTFSQVIIDDSYTKKMLHYTPEELKR
jgi:nucleoside-diphosphate-sugar epimerase